MNLPLFFSLIIAGAAATFVWRFAGIVASSQINPEGAVLRWVRAVATALVAALIARFVYAPSGLLSETHLSSRVVALSIGAVAYLTLGRRLEIGVGTTVALLLLLEAIH